MENENPWTTLESRLVYENNWIGLTEHQVINPSGGKGIYGQVSFKNLAIGILPVDDEMHTWLVGQYRYPLKAYSWEIPEGGGPLHLSPLDSAKRELQEETGLSADSWTEIQRLHLSNSVTDELAIVYLARGLTQGQAAPEDTEELVLRRLPLQEACTMAENGSITDSISVAALLKAKIMILEGKL
ncbi:NUDIX domain-containing protein [Pedobacter antarcticus]|uniref:GDP-mannose pyrophosphatase n=2 Tax=Pedobacter antarcticus TaxID=34086 RepID=A0A081PF56_9SPHI|nr:NUDIX hydrolase [Pedobacter antarcticus]KEQ29329.1 DNA mismatch repair protein MutT [Pedobacter antarcticus 4BY]SDL95888.1 NUDIX domain-containing protein [Pedobacter antarcticus]SFE77252.1 NUDIX domain-containing protein [Pedobacter antarcticus]